jgi:predicted permease
MPAGDGSEEIDQEVAFHLRERAARLVEDGMSEEEAWREARRRFGDVEEVKRAMTRQRRVGGVFRFGGWLAEDFRAALRSLRRRKGFAFTVVTMLALGIGAVTAVFTLVDGVILSPLPFPEPERLVAIRHEGSTGELDMSAGIYALYRDEATALEAIGFYEPAATNVVVGGRPERVTAMNVTPSFFDVLGVEPMLGRSFVDGEGEVQQYGAVLRPAPDPVVVIGHALWQDVLGSDPRVVGRSLDVGGTLHEIVGVMPSGFGHPDRSVQVWIPLLVDPLIANPYAFNYSGVARLAPGVSVTQAYAQLDGLRERIPELPNGSISPERWERFDIHPVVEPLKTALVGDVGSTLWILLGSVGFLLLIACANVAGLILVQADARRREHAVRVALGAGRARILTTFLGEGLALALAGGLAGMLVATGALRGTLALLPTDLPRTDEIGVDLRVLGVAVAVSLACAAFFGLAPLLQTRGDARAGRLSEGGARGSTEGVPGQRGRMGLVVLQTALALVLLVGSGLLLRSFQELRRIDPGFDPSRALTATITLSDAELPGWQAPEAFWRDVEDRLSAQPGVEAVGFGFTLPLGPGPKPRFDFSVEDQPVGPTDPPIMAYHNFVGGDYFDAMGIDIVDGRALGPDDGATGTRSVVVSRALAQRLWPDGSALGRRVSMARGWYAVIGVASDVHDEDLTGPAREMVYWPRVYGRADEPDPSRTLTIVVRTSGDPLAFTPVLRREVAAVNPRIALSSISTLDAIYRGASSRTSFTLALLGVSAATALLLGLVGIYGVVSYAAARRTREIGIRIALGASKGQVRGLVVRGGIVAASAGVVLGLVAGTSLSSAMESVLFGVSALDPVTYALAALVVLVVSVAASWIPAARAAAVEPTRALRTE